MWSRWRSGKMAEQRQTILFDGRLDLDAELKVSGCGFGICELSFAKGTDVSAVNAFLAGRILGGA